MKLCKNFGFEFYKYQKIIIFGYRVPKYVFATLKDSKS